MSLISRVDPEKVVCLAGPTATGKSDLAVALAQVLPIEIISVDSALIYRGMDIGTAKPTKALRQQVAHHLIDIRDPSESYSVAAFCREAHALILAIQARDRIPLLVGGTMLYYRALLTGLAVLPTASPAIRQAISTEAECLGWQVLHERLKVIDPVAAEQIHPNDPQRIQRALEVHRQTGRKLSDFWQVSPMLPVIKAQFIALMPSQRSLLHQRIAKRFDTMLEKGFIDEVSELRARGDLSLMLPAMRSVGYRQIWQYLEGSLDYNQMREKALAATRQLAKRQLTWLRNWSETQVFDCFDPNLLSKVLKIAF